MGNYKAGMWHSYAAVLLVLLISLTALIACKPEPLKLSRELQGR